MPDETITLTLEKLVFEGWALGRLDGMVCFVEGALPGETVEAQVVQRTKRHLFARATQVLAPSPRRLAPPCPVFGRCGGCQFLHVDYAAQLEAKKSFVLEALHFVPGIAGLVRDPLGAAEPFRFRNKMSFSIAAANGRPVVGLHERERHDRTVSARTCVLPPEAFTRIVGLTTDALATAGVSPKRWPRRLEVREGHHTGERMIYFESDAPGVLERELLEACGGECDTLVFGRSGGGPFRVLKGPGAISERLGRFEFEIGPHTFFQTNTAQAERLFAALAERTAALAPVATLELYAGVGAISCFLSAACGAVTTVEGHRGSVEAAQANLARNGIGNVRPVCADAGRLPADIAAGKYDLVVLDPPRAGLAPEALRAVLALAAPDLFYVSCHPPTLARDVRALLATRYRLLEAQPVDMFPQTFHVETLAVLTRCAP